MEKKLLVRTTFALVLFTISLGISACNRVENVDSQVTSNSEESKSAEDGCCGKCAAESETADNTAKGQTQCCGKCQTEQGDSNADQQTSAKASDAACEHCKKGEACAECKDSPATSLKTEPKDDNNKNVLSMPQDRDIFHYLLSNHKNISRKVTNLPDGVRTVTESDDPAVAKKIKQHVRSMKTRVEQSRRIRMWDELFQEIFKHTDKIKMVVEDTDNGVKVTETSDDPYVVKLIQQHAKVVTGFTKRGFEEAHQNHVPPKRK